MTPAVEVHGGPLLHEGLERQPGQVIDVSDESAAVLLESGQAVKPGSKPARSKRAAKGDADASPEAAPEPDGE